MPDNEFLAIGPYRIANRAFLAPMAGITDLPFRHMATRFGAGLVISEMIASEWLADGDQAARLRVEGEGAGLHVVQLAGCEAHWLAEGARIAACAGAHIIDINMGCPAKRVTTGEAGSALLRDPDHALRLIETVVGAVNVPVTLKMRLGWDEHSIVAPALARRAEAAGIAFISVHGRTRAQFYDGSANWKAIADVKSQLRVPLAANGDLTSYDDAISMRKDSGADAVMIGRAARGRPWFVGQVGHFLATGERRADPPLDVQRDVLIELHEAWLTHYGSIRGAREARKHIGWALEAAALRFAEGARHWAKEWRARLLVEMEPARVARGIRDAFDDIGWKVAA